MNHKRIPDDAPSMAIEGKARSRNKRVIGRQRFQLTVRLRSFLYPYEESDGSMTETVYKERTKLPCSHTSKFVVYLYQIYAREGIDTGCAGEAGDMDLPEKFLDNMKCLLGGEYHSWLASYDAPAAQGLRINTAKVDTKAWESISPFGTERVMWTSNGYLCQGERPAKHPYYYAGLYYLQEPSAMAPAAVLPVSPGDNVLDLCAAPGGKSTELGTRLYGEGLLVANDLSASRAKALLKNLELFGIPNICVTGETPKKLADTFGSFFDKILVDAPCSGEGMFRKDSELIKSWEERGPEYYAPIQREILKQAVRMMKPGGLLVYSTCTFSPVENEDNVKWLLEEEEELSLVPLTPSWGEEGGIGGMPALRFFPHKLRGEGHFLAMFRKKTEAGKALSSQKKGDRTVSSDVRCLEKESDFLQWESMVRGRFDRSRMKVKGNLVYYLPEDFDDTWNLRYLRTGLLLGEWKNRKFEPSQAAAMVLQPEEFEQSFSMKCSDERIIRYLKGETIFLNPEEKLKKGWVLVCVDGYPLGWAKYTGTSLKNKYYPGWRWQ